MKKHLTIVAVPFIVLGLTAQASSEVEPPVEEVVSPSEPPVQSADSSVSGAVSVYQEIVEMEYDGITGTTAVSGAGDWACGSDQVIIQSTLPENEQLISIVVAAYMAGTDIQFQGDCNSTTLIANKVVVRR